MIKLFSAPSSGTIGGSDGMRSMQGGGDTRCKDGDGTRAEGGGDTRCKDGGGTRAEGGGGADVRTHTQETQTATKPDSTPEKTARKSK